MTDWTHIDADLIKATWLEIALLRPSSELQANQSIFNEQVIMNLPSSVCIGLRVDHVPLIAAIDYRVFNASHTQYFANDTVSAFLSEQLAEIAPNAFGNISPFGISGLRPKVIQAI